MVGKFTMHSFDTCQLTNSKLLCTSVGIFSIFIQFPVTMMQQKSKDTTFHTQYTLFPAQVKHLGGWSCQNTPHISGSENTVHLFHHLFYWFEICDQKPTSTNSNPQPIVAICPFCWYLFRLDFTCLRQTPLPLRCRVTFLRLVFQHQGEKVRGKTHRENHPEITNPLFPSKDGSLQWNSRTPRCLQKKEPCLGEKHFLLMVVIQWYWRKSRFMPITTTTLYTGYFYM